MTLLPSPTPPTAVLPTVSFAFVEDWLAALRAYCPPAQLAGFLDQSGLAATARQPRARVTHDQIVRLYQLVAVGTGDEMMGLWSRPIRSGALKHLCVSVRGASSLSGALYRFTTFWNLLLDDYRLVLEEEHDLLRISLQPRGAALPQRFGHMLLLKLTHGIASWLAGRELPVREVGFVFPAPPFAEDYPILFPARIGFGQPCSSIAFDRSLGSLPVARSDAEMQDFLIRAPRDWIFTRYHEHTLPLRVREMLQAADRMAFRLDDAAGALHLTPRTLMRRLEAEGTSFQDIKDGLRRDIAIRDLTRGDKSLEAISQDIGFASVANFHRAFRRWTGLTPGAYRRDRKAGRRAPRELTQE
ncbi:AraC family transcriptional regulator [Pseudodonghicola flavimaris]|uniref:AraC family transcriptional regulator ligand-binding domain-containing protein n=1 Tax=Pseudodonghicola flavimaris TaxID=3050036 RepID=A0ABT7F879_9RHOB|nr:AraC family transcriptional regulator [Pseudodonghicola flavimaris]MDK3020815.1 AraC family transcriptional regulator ligand-binding domain-containing protein [Pseudodonghicola flavimaris]